MQGRQKEGRPRQPKKPPAKSRKFFHPALRGSKRDPKPKRSLASCLRALKRTNIDRSRRTAAPRDRIDNSASVRAFHQIEGPASRSHSSFANVTSFMSWRWSSRARADPLAPPGMLREIATIITKSPACKWLGGQAPWSGSGETRVLRAEGLFIIRSLVVLRLASRPPCSSGGAVTQCAYA
jgi:hypothetical protein